MKISHKSLALGEGKIPVCFLNIKCLHRNVFNLLTHILCILHNFIFHSHSRCYLVCKMSQRRKDKPNTNNSLDFSCAY